MCFICYKSHTKREEVSTVYNGSVRVIASERCRLGLENLKESFHDYFVYDQSPVHTCSNTDRAAELKHSQHDFPIRWDFQLHVFVSQTLAIVWNKSYLWHKISYRFFHKSIISKGSEIAVKHSQPYSNTKRYNHASSHCPLSSADINSIIPVNR